MFLGCKFEAFGVAADIRGINNFQSRGNGFGFCSFNGGASQKAFNLDNVDGTMVAFCHFVSGLGTDITEVNGASNTKWIGNANQCATQNKPGRPTVTGSRGGNAALADLLTELSGLGLIVDSTTA
jgi:hypothetical protein